MVKADVCSFNAQDFIPFSFLRSTLAFSMWVWWDSANAIMPKITLLKMFFNLYDLSRSYSSGFFSNYLFELRKFS
jgi:hypothetical protein